MKSFQISRDNSMSPLRCVMTRAARCASQLLFAPFRTTTTLKRIIAMSAIISAGAASN